MAVTINGSAGVTTNTGAVYNGLQTGTVNAGGTNPFPSSAGPATVDFTGIPNWVKRITVMFNGVSTNGTSNLQLQIGAGSVTTSGYSSYAQIFNSATLTNTGTVTTGFVIWTSAATNTKTGVYTLVLLTGNTWVCTGNASQSSSQSSQTSGAIDLGGTLDRVRITTVNGTDLFDAGSINIIYE